MVTGIYDIEPALHACVNREVKLTPEMVRRNSPMFNPPARQVPVLLAVGANETVGWIGQSVDYEKVCRMAGCPTEFMKIPGQNHHSMTFTHSDPEHPLVRKMIEWMRG